MEFRVLRYFLAVAEAGSISKAAAVLNLTQPTLSRQIKDLEEELGQRLLVRGHRISLTAEGRILRKRAEEIIDMVGKTRAEFNTSRTQISGDIYIGGGETRGMSLIAEVIGQLRDKHPGICCHLYSGNAEDVTERLDKGLLDFGILIQPTDLSECDSIRLPVKDVWGVVMPKNDPLAQKDKISRKDLSGLPLICSRQVLAKTSPHNEFLNWFGDDFEKMNIVATYNLLFNAALLVEQRIGYALTLDKLINTMENSRICFRPLFPAVEAELDIVWKKYRIMSPAAKIFQKMLQERFTTSLTPKKTIP